MCVVRPDDQCIWFLLEMLHGAIRYYQLKGRSHRYTVRSLEDMCNRCHPVGGCVLGMSTWCVCAKNTRVCLQQRVCCCLRFFLKLHGSNFMYARLALGGRMPPDSVVCELDKWRIGSRYFLVMKSVSTLAFSSGSLIRTIQLPWVSSSVDVVFIRCQCVHSCCWWSTVLCVEWSVRVQRE